MADDLAGAVEVRVAEVEAVLLVRLVLGQHFRERPDRERLVREDMPALLVQVPEGLVKGQARLCLLREHDGLRVQLERGPDLHP